MRLFRLERSQFLSIPPPQAWDFFSDPRNLARITPPELNLNPTSPVPETMYPGLIFTYRVRILPGVRVNWVTEITHVEAPRFFVDEQRFGPYRFWHHLHRFTPSEGGVAVEDIVHYGLYGGPLAGLIDALAVRPQLARIFDYRRQALEDSVAASTAGPTAPGN